MLQALSVDRPGFLPWLPWTATDNRTVEECGAAIERQRLKRERLDPPADDFTIAISDARSGDVLGGTGLHRIIHGAHEAEIGYWMRADRRRQGLCQEAVAALVTWAFRSPSEGGWGLRRIHIRCASLNAASRQVPQRLGFVHEATLRKERWVDGLG
jgi:RimJ/RimL family protein N-acetyltransferase